MSNFIQTKPEMSASFGSLQIRQDLLNYSVTIGFKDFSSWHPDTEQVQISKKVIHFIQPDGEWVGLKVFS